MAEEIEVEEAKIWEEISESLKRIEAMLKKISAKLDVTARQSPEASEAEEPIDEWDETLDWESPFVEEQKGESEEEW